jgi:anti-sigma28 factor (negative regulator of flagellin synthesis)
MNEINQIQIAKASSLHKTDQVVKSAELVKSDSAEAKKHDLALLDKAATSANRGSDRVEVSAAGAALAEASAQESAAREASIRIEKVAKIRSDIQNGIYDIDGRLEYIVDDLIDDITNE